MVKKWEEKGLSVRSCPQVPVLFIAYSPFPYISLTKPVDLVDVILINRSFIT